MPIIDLPPDEFEELANLDASMVQNNSNDEDMGSVQLPSTCEASLLLQCEEPTLLLLHEEFIPYEEWLLFYEESVPYGEPPAYEEPPPYEGSHSHYSELPPVAMDRDGISVDGGMETNPALGG